MLLSLESAAEASANAGGEPPRLEHGSWDLRPGRLKGQTAYDYVAEGVGPMEGVRVLWGSLPKLPAGSVDNRRGSGRRFKVMLGSEVLWRHYVNGGNAHTAAVETMELLLGVLWSAEPRSIKVRRLDICMDHWGYQWCAADLYTFACRQKKRGIFEEFDVPADQLSTFHGPVSSTYYVGARGGASRFLRVYNKTAEAKKSGKSPWMEPIWERFGWDGKANLWRAEVEFGGEWLNAHGFDSLEKLRNCEAALMLDYFSDVRHTTGRSTRNKRSATSPVWLHLRETALHHERNSDWCAWRWKPRPPAVGGDMKQLEAMGGGVFRKIGEAMFHGARTPEDRAALLAFVSEAIDKAAAAAARRDAKRAQPARKPMLAAATG